MDDRGDCLLWIFVFNEELYWLERIKNPIILLRVLQCVVGVNAIEEDSK